MRNGSGDRGRRTGLRALLASLCLLLAACDAPARRDGVAGFVDEYAGTHDFSGTVVVQHEGAVVYRRSYGLANRQFAVPNGDDTKYKIASITKLFTAVLILALRDQGKLALDATVATYLPDYAGEAATKVTVHQLLNHTSGMRNADQDADPARGVPHYQMPMASDELVRRHYSGPLVAEPGRAFDYNNADYILLGKIVEALHKKPFDVVLSEQILQPLEMRATGMVRQAEIVEHLADTYFHRDDSKVLTCDLPVYMENWFAAGAMYSTASDLLKFADALHGDRLLSPASRELMLTPGLDDYGYGLWIEDVEAAGKKVRVYRRPGQIMGAQTMLIRYHDIDLTIVVLANASTASPDEFAFAIGRKFLNGELK